MVQWLRVRTPEAGSPGSIPGQGTRSHWPQLRVCLPQLKDPTIPQFSSVQFFVTPWTTARQASLSITNSWSLLKLMSIELAMPSNLILCRPLLLLLPPSIRVFSNESVIHIRYPKYWSFTCTISPSNEHPGLISFRMDWLDLLAVQGTLRSLFTKG